MRLFGIEMSFLWHRDGQSLLCWYRDLFFGIEILHSVVQHLDHLLPGINLCVLVWGLEKLEAKEDPLNGPFLNGLFSSRFSRDKTASGTKSGKRPTKVGKRPIKEGKRPMKAEFQSDA